MNKQLEKELIDEIKKSTSKKWFYKLDKLFKIRKIKILKYELKDCFGVKSGFRVRYTEKFNLFSVFTWMFFIYFCLYSLIKTTILTIKEVCKEMAYTHRYSKKIYIKQWLEGRKTMVINIERDIKKNINVGDVVVTPMSCYMVIKTVDNKFSLLNLENGRCIYNKKTFDELAETVFKAVKIIKIISNSKLELNEIQE